MGKDSKHQRTKGGVQPSSSSRTAELLQKSGGSGSGALSFFSAAAEAQKELGLLSSPASAYDSLLTDDDLPPEVRMIFRKLQKKDAVTKIKALAELTQVLGGPTVVTSRDESPSSREASLERPVMSPEEIETLSKTLLPHWIKAYQKLIVDDSRKVREQAQVALTQICKNVGRNLAPHLKQLIPSWYLAQNDLYSPVSYAAKKAFKTAFPSEVKQTDVIRFCKTDILRAILENLRTLFGVIQYAEQGNFKDKKQKGKKKESGKAKDNEEDSNTMQEEAEVAVTATPQGASSTKSEEESCAMRLVCATFLSLKTMIEQNLVDYEILEEVFGQGGLFWRNTELSSEILVRCCMYDLLSSLSALVWTSRTSKDLPRPEDAPALQFAIPSNLCTKFISNALNVKQKESLPNLWRAFLLLTVHGVLTDTHMARKQLLNCCKNGFYGNARQIGSAILPLINRIWEGFGEDQSSKQEFSHDIIAACMQGYGAERSIFEKAGISRALVDVVAFLCQQDVIDMGPVYQFMYANISDLTSDFARLFGNLVKDNKFYEGFLQYGFENDISTINTNEFGRFIVNVCNHTAPEAGSSSARHHQGGGPPRRHVKFHEQRDNEASSSPSQLVSFSTLSEQKQQFLMSVFQTCVNASVYKPLVVISKTFKDQQLWSSINIAEIDICLDENKLTRLQLYLQLIQLYPEVPSLLAKVSNEFEHFQDGPNFKLFLWEIEPYVSLPPIKRWLRMPHFTAVIEDLLQNVELNEAEISTILKFVFRSLFSQDFIIAAVDIIMGRIANDPAFFEHLDRVLAVTSFPIDLTPLYRYYWELYFQKSLSFVSTEQSPDLELIETVCFKNLEHFDPSHIAQILEKYLESCDKLKQIQVLIDINKRLGYPVEMLQPSSSSLLKIKSDVLAFLGFSYSDLVSDTLDCVPKFSKVHLSAVSKAIFKGRLIVDSDAPSRLVIPLIHVIYAQALNRIWEEVEKSSYFDQSNMELSKELELVSTRLTERVYEDKSAWNSLWEEMTNLEANSGDPLWQSRLPLRVLLVYCSKAELPPVLKKVRVSPTEDNFENQVRQVMEEFSQNLFKTREVIAWITERRVKEPDYFEFESLFKHIKNKPFVHKLLVIATELIRRVDKDDEVCEEYLSLATCWISAWLKQSKNLTVSSKCNLLWVASLSRSCKIVSEKASNVNELCPKFTQEYVEFHAGQLFPVIYALYLQLNEVPTHSFWTLQTLLYVSEALVKCPSPTLGFIEPDGVKLCETFGKILGEGAAMHTRIAAYRILKKVKYDKDGETDLPIVPPVIDTVVKNLLEKLQRSEIEDEDTLISYLLIWDALLKIQQGSVEFATYVRDQEHLLTPFLNTLFFSDRICLEDATAKHFDQEIELEPGEPVNILQLACGVVQRTLRNLPYTVRWWWNNQVTRQRDRVFVEKFIVKHLSTKLASEELGSVKLRDGVDDNVTVNIHSGCNELIAHYKIEETNVTLTVCLPLNHPLGPVTVKISDKKLHGKISHLLNTRSHSLSAGLKLWKENLDGLYKDVDECAICFFILHNVSKQIPKLACKTCKKKFHAACLYKWFSTSNKSECPLCRTLF